jgi:hypothetical protein
VFQRILRRFGYVPFIPPTFAGDSIAPAPAIVPAHRRVADTFDFDAARCDDLCFSYDDGDEVYSYAIGRDGWAPLAVAALAIVGTARCVAHLRETVQERLWLNDRDDEYDDWVSANEPVFKALRESLERADRDMMRRAPPADARDFERDMLPYLATVQIGAEFAQCWMRARTPSPVFFLATSTEHAALASQPAIRAAVRAADDALERCFDWLALWFEARGLTVDRERRLVSVAGYQALFLRASQGI